MDDDMKSRLGRAALRALFCDDAADVSDEDARGNPDALREAPPNIREIAARAIAAEYLRLAVPAIADLVEPVAAGLAAVEEGRPTTIFLPRAFGTIVGMPRLVEVARDDLARYAIRCAEFRGGEVGAHSEDASLTAAVGIDRSGRELKGVTPLLPLSGRSRETARELRVRGVKLVSIDERRLFRAAGIASRRGQPIDPDVAAYLDGWRARFAADAEGEWLRAGITRRSRRRNNA
jgi:hypothetical protein